MCSAWGIKGIVIENLSPSGEVSVDVMTSSVVKTTYLDAFNEMNEIASELTALDFDVIRRKIETVSWNFPDNPDQKGYFETHIEFDVADIDHFSVLVRQLGGYVSRNANKPGKAIATLRRNARSWFLYGYDLGPFVDGIESAGYVANKTLNEYCPYDDNPTHDDSWIKG
jgi:hypothetical protein